MKASLFNDLIKRIYDGDMSALEPIYQEYYGKMIIDGTCILRNSHDGEDAASNAMMAFLEHIHADKLNYYVSNPGGYMYTLLKREAFDIYEKRRTINIDKVNPIQFVSTDGAEKRLENLDLYKAFEFLSGRQYEIAVKFYLYGYHILEICKELNLTEGTVKWHLNQLRERLRSILTRD